ncbi:MAG: SlyX family protein [Burkholderiaceae bacterium]|nr:SlyX family protein [Burkholderiaceae bacterium]
MDALSRGEQRLEALEIKASYTEDLLDQLNLVIYRQQEQIDALLREVGRLREQAPSEGAAPVRHLRDELPPHY